MPAGNHVATSQRLDVNFQQVQQMILRAVGQSAALVSSLIAIMAGLGLQKGRSTRRSGSVGDVCRKRRAMTDLGLLGLRRPPLRWAPYPAPRRGYDG